MKPYKNMTHDDEVRILEQIIQEDGITHILSIGDVYSVLREHYNNDILERWKAEIFKPVREKHQLDVFHYINNTEKQRLFGVINGTFSPHYFKSVQELAKFCLNPPSELQKQLVAINELLEGNGIEHHVAEEIGRDFYYINMGDQYIPTIIYDIVGNYFFVGCHDDLLDLKTD